MLLYVRLLHLERYSDKIRKNKGLLGNDNGVDKKSARNLAAVIGHRNSFVLKFWIETTQEKAAPAGGLPLKRVLKMGTWELTGLERR